MNGKEASIYLSNFMLGANLLCKAEDNLKELMTLVFQCALSTRHFQLQCYCIYCVV